VHLFPECLRLRNSYPGRKRTLPTPIEIKKGQRAMGF
jgi:hypothetical protein